jgi:hypothetical protein
MDRFTKKKQLVVVSLLVAIYIIINIFVLGGDPFVINLNNNLSNLLAIGVTILAILLWRRVSAGSRNRSLWTGLALGWILWTIAEIWWSVAAILGQEIPYPSEADYFWLLGYIPMYIALAIRTSSLPKNFDAQQKASMWGASLIVIGSTVVFILLPVLRSNDLSRLVESILNILYPLADLTLLVLVLRIFFAYQKGRYGRAWTWLSIGFILHSISNLIFSYVISIDLYYPNGQANLASTLAVDTPYTLSYLFWLIGLFSLQNMHATYLPYAKTESSLSLVPNTHINIVTKADDTIITASQNFQSVFPNESIQGKTLQEATGMNVNTADEIWDEIRTQLVIQERSVRLVTNLGTQTAQTSGIAVINPDMEYSGAILILRLTMPDDSFDSLLTDYQKSITRSVLEKTGGKSTRENEIEQLLSGYYLAYIKALYNRIVAEGGAIMADAMVAELQSIAHQNNWTLEVKPEIPSFVKVNSFVQMKEAYPALLETARNFVSRILDQQAVDAIVHNIDLSMDDSVHHNVAYCMKAII